MNGTRQYVTLGVGEELFAAPVERVQEILELRPIAKLPKAPANLLGMIDLRGQGIPVVDLRRTLDMADAGDTDSTRIVVLKVCPKGGLETTLALKTDRVFEVTVLDDEALDPQPEIGARWQVKAIAGIGRRNGAFVSVLDLDQLFATPDLVEHAPSRADRAA
ncbi:chemotaxis protein CheW [Mesorhizobium sp. RP14(2022)]|uniref:Chemotaxis protein CheW n=1 Tax=Mesorhizobium liriopis TaxID=2953882 RepID=A0ABT1CAP6_9HYPH|nr:chemotaxis protein CheW [Mesorhizobium liriopis]MCO6051051.1 chemotaxis protein CheW [Mesorhizobium liriopis]